MVAAEKLFADRGIEAVSLREIALTAGHGNNNAVQYHFGSKDGLVQAIFTRRVSEMDGRRRMMLAEAEAAGRLADARTLLEILFLPILTLVDEEGRHTYAGFMIQYLTRYRPIGVRHAADEASENSQALRRLLSLLEARLSYIPNELVKSRLALCALMFYSMLVRADAVGLQRKNASAFAAQLNDTLEIITVSLCAPYRHPSIEGGVFHAIR